MCIIIPIVTTLKALESLKNVEVTHSKARKEKKESKRISIIIETNRNQIIKCHMQTLSVIIFNINGLSHQKTW